MKQPESNEPKTASGIPVHCRGCEVVNVADLVPYPGNPNRHSDEQVALLAKIIRARGWRHPIIVSRLSGRIVAGHGRLQAALLLQVAEVPVERQDFPDDAAEREFLLSDNRLAELAERDNALVKDLLEQLDTGATDMDLTGYTAQAIEALMLQEHVEPYGDTSTDRDGQGVATTWESCKKTGAAPVRIGPMESRVTVETAQKIVEKCNRAFSENGTPINDTLEAMMLCALQ